MTCCAGAVHHVLVNFRPKLDIEKRIRQYICLCLHSLVQFAQLLRPESLENHNYVCIWATTVPMKNQEPSTVNLG